MGKPADLAMSRMFMNNEIFVNKSEPVIVAEIWEDLWLGVKF